VAPANPAVSGNRLRFGGSETDSLATTFLVDDALIP
jgi:hypothetical protein